MLIKNSDKITLSNAESTFLQSTRMERLLKTLSCWYSLDSLRRVFSDEYPCARVLSHYSVFHFIFCIGKSDQQHKVQQGIPSAVSTVYHSPRLYLNL